MVLGAAFESFYLFFQPCNLGVFKLFYKDLWDRREVVLSPEHLSVYCTLAGSSQMPFDLAARWS